MTLATIQWAEYADLILLDLPGCPIPAIIDAVRKAAIRFCRKSEVWWIDSSATDIIAGQSAYNCVVDDNNVKVSNVTKIKVAEQEVEPISRAGWDDLEDDTARQPLNYRVTAPNLVHLWPTPLQTISGAMVVRVVLQPSRTSLVGPEFLMDEHEEAITAGARAYLMLQPNKAWSNPQLAAVQWRNFEQKIDSARFKEERGGTVAPLRKTKMGI